MGKSCLIVAYMFQKFEEHYEPTVFENYKRFMMFQGSQIEHELFDTCGD